VTYKYSVGRRGFGDIDYEGDDNTQIDFDVDFVALVTNGVQVLSVSGSRAGIGTATPDYTLDVAGTVGIDEYIYHNGDDDTFIRFQPDEINIKAGDINFISITEDTQDKIVFNDGANDVDFIVRSPNESKALYLNAANEVLHINHGDSNFQTKIHSTNGNALEVNNSGVIINEGGYVANDFRVESTSNTHMLFVDAGTEKIGIKTNQPEIALDINDIAIRIRNDSTPSSASDFGMKGEIRWDTNYIYICVATDTWKRTAVSSW